MISALSRLLPAAVGVVACLGSAPVLGRHLGRTGARRTARYGGVGPAHRTATDGDAGPARCAPPRVGTPDRAHGDVVPVRRTPVEGGA
ncbi:hypothetical protein [Streptomyces sp. SGAir0957]